MLRNKMLRTYKGGIIKAMPGEFADYIYNPSLTKHTIYGDKFGNSMDANGEYLIIGAEDTYDASAKASGAAYVYDLKTRNLIYSFTGGEYGDFGTSVAINDTYAVVSEPGADYDGEVSLGRVHVYNINTGNLVYSLDSPTPAPDKVSGQVFGSSISISNNYLIVGEPSGRVNGVYNVGRAYIFDLDTGALLHHLNDAAGEGQWSRFGTSVSINDQYAVVGASRIDLPNSTVESGAVFIYNSNTGSLINTVYNPNDLGDRLSDMFGSSVAISDNNRIIATAPDEYDNTTDRNKIGKGYLIDAATGNVLHVLHSPNPYTQDDSFRDDMFGESESSVSINDKYIVIGAAMEHVNGVRTGIAYVFDTITGALLHTFEPGEIIHDQRFGWATAITGEEVFVSQLYGVKNYPTSSYKNDGRIHIFGV